MLRVIVVSTFVFTLACETQTPSRPESVVVSGSSKESATAVNPAIDAAVLAVCDSALVRWQHESGAIVTSRDTVLGPGDFITDYVADKAVEVPPSTRYPGCVVIGEHPTGADTDIERRLYWKSANWLALPRLIADGPDGGVVTYQKGWVRCQVSNERDGGDDGDSTYIPAKFYRETTLCWRHSRQIEAADTMQGLP